MNIIELLEKALPKSKPVIANMLQEDEVYNERGMDGVKAYNQALQDVKNSLPQLLEIIAGEIKSLEKEYRLEDFTLNTIIKMLTNK